MSTIFEEFAGLDARPDSTGTGLGLAIVRALVTAHGGRVWCEETEGGGATFVFVSRLAGRSRHDDGARDRGRRAAAPRAPHQPAGRGRSTSSRPRTARRRWCVVADGRADVVLLDLGLPELDGIDVLRRMRSFSDVPVVVLTARDRQQDKVARARRRRRRLRDQAVRRRGAAGARARGAAPRPARLDGRRRSSASTASRSTSSTGRFASAATPVHLTKTELELLELLVTHPGKLLTHEYILRAGVGPGYGTESNYLRVYVGQLRRKLDDDAANPRLIVTEPGIGYRWIARGELATPARILTR